VEAAERQGLAETRRVGDGAELGKLSTFTRLSMRGEHHAACNKLRRGDRRAMRSVFFTALLARAPIADGSGEL